MPEIRTAEEFFEHFGVKGMKWGVRNDQGHEGQSASPRKINKLDQKFETKAGTTKTFFDVYNKGAQDFNDNKIDAINNKPLWRKHANAGTFRNDNHPATKQYHKEVQDSFVDSLNKAANSLGTNASGTKKLGVHILDGDNDWSLVLEDVKHAAESISLKVTKSPTGLITSIALVEPMNHSEEFVDEFFEHFGVKGMKWGVRRGDNASSSPTSNDAAKASKFQQVAKKSGTRALSNEDLQTLVTRMNLEQQYNRLKPPTPTKKATKFVGDFLLSVGKQQASKFANDQFGKFIAGQLGKPRNRQPKVLRITSLR